MDYDCISVQCETVRRSLPVENVLHIEFRKIQFVTAPLDEFVQFRAELLYLFLASVQHDQISSRNHLQSRKIGAEFCQYLISGPINFYGVHSFQCNVFSHIFILPFTGPPGRSNPQSYIYNPVPQKYLPDSGDSLHVVIGGHHFVIVERGLPKFAFSDEILNRQCGVIVHVFAWT